MSVEDDQRHPRLLATAGAQVQPDRQKTHGTVVGSEEVVISGEDQESDEVWQRLLKAGLPTKMKPMSIDHVEMKGRSV